MKVGLGRRNFVAEIGEDDFSLRFRIPVVGRESSLFFRIGRIKFSSSGNLTSGELRPGINFKT